MPLLFILTIVVQILLVVHIVKTGRNNFWIYLVIFAPMIGAVAYILVEWLPEFFVTRTGRKVTSGVDSVLNPNRKLKHAAQNYEIADTVENARRFAQECLDTGRFGEASDLFQKSLKGIYEDDPNLMLGLARSFYGLEQYPQVKSTLNDLKAKNPEFQNAEAHLLYAKALDKMNDAEEALQEYTVLADYYPGPEPTVRLGLLLKKLNKTDEADQHFRRVLTLAKTSGRSYRGFHKTWIDIAKREITH